MPAAASSSAVQPISAVLPEYEVSRELGRGAMGVVYLARHRKLGRSVAVKELAGPLASDPDVRSRFLSEARTLASLDHPHVVPVYDYVESGGRCLLIMEALPGGTVWSTFTSKGLTLAQSCALVLAACSGVQHAHEHGVLHRDLKPENLLFTAAGDLKVADFGIAKVLDGGRTLATVDGSVLGTPAYMAPEQAEGSTVGRTADVYALGTILYELASGRLPFDGDSPMALLVQRISKDAPSLHALAPAVPAPVADVVMTCLDRDPARRFESAEALGCALGAAATASLGSDWLGATGVQVSGSRTILVSATSAAGTPTIAPRIAAPASPTMAPGGAVPASPTMAPGGAVPAPPTMAPGGVAPAPPTMAPGGVAPAPGDTAVSPAADPTATPMDTGTIAPIGRADTAPTVMDVPAAAAVVAPGAGTIVRPRLTSHEPGFHGEIRRSDLVSIDELTRTVAATQLPAIVTAVALVVAVLLALLVPVARPALGGPGRLGGLRVGGAPVGPRTIATVDLSKPVVLGGLNGGRTASVSYRLLGIPVASANSAIVNGRASLDAKMAGLAVHGPVTMHVEVRGPAGRTLAARDVAVVSSRGPLLSAQLYVLAAIALAALSAAEGNSRRHRKGRVVNSAVVKAALSGAVAMVAISLLWSMFRPGLPATPRVALLAVVSALGFGALTVLRARRARQRRLRWKADR